MFLKQKRSEMDDFERRKEFGGKGKIVQYFKKNYGKIFQDFNGLPLQKFHKTLFHILVFRNIRSIFIFFEKKIVFFSVR